MAEWTIARNWKFRRGRNVLLGFKSQTCCQVVLVAKPEKANVSEAFISQFESGRGHQISWVYGVIGSRVWPRTIWRNPYKFKSCYTHQLHRAYVGIGRRARLKPVCCIKTSVVVRVHLCPPSVIYFTAWQARYLDEYACRNIAFDIE